MSELMSDNYSYLDQSSDEMGVKGQGGLRQCIICYITR